MKRFVRPSGFGSPAESYAENDIDWNTVVLPKPNAMFVFPITGSKFEEYSIISKDLAIVDRSLVPGKGDLVVLVLDGDFGIKKYTGAEREIVGVVSRLVRLFNN